MEVVIPSSKTALIIIGVLANFQQFFNQSHRYAEASTTAPLYYTSLQLVSFLVLYFLEKSSIQNLSFGRPLSLGQITKYF